MRFICTMPNWHNGHLYRRGQVVDTDPKNLPHDKEGKLRHFEPLDAGAPAPAPHEGGVEITVNEKKQRR